MILGKSGVDGLDGIQNLGFDGFELYVKIDDDLEKPLKLSNLKVVHQPKLIQAQGYYLPFDLADNSIEGHFSEKALERTVKYALKHDVNRVVSHGGFVDRTISDLQEGQEIVAKRINRIHHPEVLICLENDPIWSNSMWINEPVLINLKDFQNTLDLIEVPVGVCVDIEHLYRSAILSSFYHKYENEFRMLEDEEEYDSLVAHIDRQFIGYVSNPPRKIQLDIHNYVHDFFTGLKPYIKQLHVCGFDYLHDCTKHREHILPGAHLPLNYSGPSGGMEVQDRVDHEQYLNYVKDMDVDVVIEVNSRAEYDYLSELRNSLEYLRGCLK